MTNTELLAKIKAEIERRIDIIKPKAGQGIILCEQLTKRLQDLLSFLDTLESEKPMNQDEDLEEEIDRIVKCEKEFMNFKYKSQLIGYIARHFAEWGAEHLTK